MVIVVSKMALSLTTGTSSTDQVSGTYQNLPKGILKLYALGSVTGMTYTVIIGGIALANTQPVPWFGTTGTMKRFDHLILEQNVMGGRPELYFQNPTAGTVTVDYILEHVATR